MHKLDNSYDLINLCIFKRRERETCRERESKDDEGRKEIEGRKGRVSES